MQTLRKLICLPKVIGVSFKKTQKSWNKNWIGFLETSEEISWACY